MAITHVHEALSHLIDRYGSKTCIAAWLSMLILLSIIAYFFFIKPLYHEIALYQSTIDHVEALEKKFGSLLQNPHTNLPHLQNAQTFHTTADISIIIEHALKQKLTIESSTHQQGTDRNQHIIVLKGTFEDFIQFLEHIYRLPVSLLHVIMQPHEGNITAQLTFDEHVSSPALPAASPTAPPMEKL